MFIDERVQVMGADGNPILTETGDIIFSRNSGTYCADCGHDRTPPFKLKIELIMSQLFSGRKREGLVWTYFRYCAEKDKGTASDAVISNIKDSSRKLKL